MNFRAVIHLTSVIIMILGLFMGLVAGTSWLMQDTPDATEGMLAATGLSIGAGFLMWFMTRGKVELSRREGIGIVVFGWFIGTLIGGLPFLTTGAMSNPFDAFFESASGFTTTGASVMTDLENHSRAILLWRACTHLIGGMGILVLVVAIIPFLGVGGMQIYRAEVTGPSKDRLTPRIASTAKLLWVVYIFLIVVNVLLLRIGGMNWFDSVCHAFAAISTGGFSTRSEGIRAFDSAYIEMVLIIFIVIGGTNFALHYRALIGNPGCYLKDSEFRFFMGLLLSATLIMTLDLTLRNHMQIQSAIRHSAFYAASLMTTTGFTTVDYNAWPALSKVIILLMLVCGGCAGSTSGALKQIRLLLLLKNMTRSLKTLLKPQAVYTVKVNGQIVPQEILVNVLIFFFIYMGTLAVGSIVMTSFHNDVTTCVSAVFSALGGVGPGLGSVGPVLNYSLLPDGGKAWLALLMLVGRLEFYTVLAIFLPMFWRK